ncbi:dTDP-4-dehydrorhamnose 3,5-epimerase [Prevotella sp. P5-92]|uniref:dTDP-4-dehydrorhamnose 3,5-epimerase family protein n=1 Tax=Prevotella sp. P5-92 TaxID=2024222 RepID=UPI000B96ED42|nr:dTDP-4-dehydrorhamnose 3,5-epimerase [Prevotella sp. P5-92]OYP55543.1 dTDP-4-dehydrorhamnose 3,5-epimerase [Prevotella sp. P5-92]
MNVIPTNIPGVLIIEPRVFKDSRGYFFESFSQREFDEKVTPILGHSINFVQDNESMSSYGVIRGLHYQRMPYTQSKLVRCVKGAVLDVAVDIRKGSPTFGQHVSCLLTGRDEEGVKIAEQLAKDTVIKNLRSLMSTETNKQCANNQQSLIGREFFIPRGFAHGFAVLSETAVFQYKCDEFYHPEADGGINIKDETLGIDWRIPMEKAILSEKDLKHACLKDAALDFDISDKLY